VAGTAGSIVMLALARKTPDCIKENVIRGLLHKQVKKQRHVVSFSNIKKIRNIRFVPNEQHAIVLFL